MRVLMLAPYTLGDTIADGAQRHVKSIINRLRSYNDLEIHVISISQEIKKDRVLKKEGVTVHQIKAIKLPMTIAGVTLYPIKILREVKKIKPDLIHGQMIGAPYGLATGKLSKKYPTLLTVHTIMKQESKTNRSLLGRIHDTLWRLLEKWELKRIPYLVVVSPYLKEELKEDGARNVHVIPNGIEASWFDIPDKSIAGRILFVGRILPIKGIEFLIKAMKLVIDKEPSAHLHIVGPTDDRQYLKHLQELTKKLGVSEYVDFTEVLYGDDLLKEYAECSVFVLPSLDESFGIVLLEAMASGKSIIATDVGGIPQMIENEKNGILVNYDDIEGLAEKILMLINDKKLREELSKNGRKYARNFSWIEIAKKTYMLYNQILKP